jgi:SAM-dependent methyltransferase
VDLVVGHPYDWKEIDDQSFDVVVSGQALEHIEYIWLTILEIARVTRANGLVVLIAPSRGQVHRYPTDCWRFYPDGLPALSRYAGLEVLESHLQQSYAYPGRIQWGTAVLIARRPKRTASEEAQWAVRCRAAKLAIAPAVTAAHIAGLRIEARNHAPSPIKPTGSLNAIARRERERLDQLNRWRVRAGLAYWHLRGVLRALHKPFEKLSDFDR